MLDVLRIMKDLLSVALFVEAFSLGKEVYVNQDKIYNKYNFWHEITKIIKLLCVFCLLASIFTFVKNDIYKGICNLIYEDVDPIFIYMVVGILCILERKILYKKSDLEIIVMKYLDIDLLLTYILISLSGYEDWENKIFLISMALLCGVLKYILKSKINENIKKSNASNNVLYSSRKKQLDFMEEIITKDSLDNFAIAINGEWGSGKSEIINNIISESKKNGTKYYTIYMKPMISDTKEALLKEFIKVMRRLMKENGIYDGRKSSLDEFYKAALDAIQINNKVSLGNFFFLDKDEESFRETKEKLQSDIDLLLNRNINNNENNNKKILIIIDDFDRVDQENQKDILSFVKEIVDFKGCKVLIALDYKLIEKNNIINSRYLEKFIGERIELGKISFDEIIKFHVEKKENLHDNSNGFINEIICDIKENIITYKEIIYDNKKRDIKNDLDDIGKSELYDENHEKYKKYLDIKNEGINNPRRIKQFLKSMDNSIILFGSMYGDVAVENGLTPKDIAKIIYLFNYIKAFYNKDYEEIIRHKTINNWMRDLKLSDNKLNELYYKILLKDIINLEDNVKEINFLLNRGDKDYEEVIRMKENNECLIDNIFINYSANKSKLEIYTNSQKIINIIDSYDSSGKENKIGINDDYVNTLLAYKKVVEKYNNDKEAVTRHKKLGQIICELYNKNNISVSEVMKIISNKNEYNSIEFLHYYMHAILVNENKDNNKKFFSNEGVFEIKSYIETMERVNIKRHIYYINVLIEENFKIKGIDTDINYFIIENGIDFNRLKSFCKSNKLIEDEKEISNEYLFEQLLLNLKNKEYVKNEIIEEIIYYIEKNINIFLANEKSIENFIEKIKQIEKEYNKPINLIDTYRGAIDTLNDLNNEEAYGKMLIYKCMSRALGQILEYKKGNKISNDVNSKIKGALIKIKEKNVISDLQMINILKLIEKINEEETS